DACHERAQIRRASAPSSDHDLVAGPAFGFDPGFTALRAVRGAEPLRDNTFETYLARGAQKRLTGIQKVIYIADRRLAQKMLVQELLQAGFALSKGVWAHIRAIRKEQIERKVDEILGSALRERSLERGEMRYTLGVERHHFSIDNAVG